MKTAVILFNLGGPDAPQSVEPFLFNLFSDPAIIALPNPIRWFLARLISGRRAPIAREIYRNLGGGSPLVPNTERQAAALAASLGDGYKVFLAMRYWHPRAAATIAEVKAWSPDRIVLLPLYPQYSTTTTASSVREWSRVARRAGLKVPTSLICCYPTEAGFVAATAERVRAGLAAVPEAQSRRRILFSAHGLPQNIVDGGDPYAWQVEQTVIAVMDALSAPDVEHVVCYQSRVGPRQWLRPSTDDEIRRAGAEGVALVVVPIAFVSEHSETLVELDIEYRELAHEANVPAYIRVPTVDTLTPLIEGLARLVREATAKAPGICSCDGGRICPSKWSRCAFQEVARELGA